MNLALLFHSVLPRYTQSLKRWWTTHTPVRTLPDVHGVHVPLAKRAAQRPVRILSVHEAGQPQFSAGRMVISGRMADVCAELDRLAAQESAAS